MNLPATRGPYYCDECGEVMDVISGNVDTGEKWVLRCPNCNERKKEGDK